MKIVTIGGGTGTYTSLMGLKHISRDLTAIVTMADDGGSSGRLRDEFGHLPPGDTRRCLLALSDESQTTLRALFEYRFNRGHGLNGHSFGNLFLTALTELTGSTKAAILQASRLLSVRGRVLPVTTDDSRLCAELEDGTLIRGEHNIDVRSVKPHLRIRRVFLDPPSSICDEAREAIQRADIVLLGPGDLYTSLIPNLLVDGVSEAIHQSPATCVLACNLMTKHGETNGFRASDFLGEVQYYLGSREAVDCVLVHSGEFSEQVRQEYAGEQAFPVEADIERCAAFGPMVFSRDLAANGHLVRHDSVRLTAAVVEAHRSYLKHNARGGVTSNVIDWNGAVNVPQGSGHRGPARSSSDLHRGV